MRVIPPTNRTSSIAERSNPDQLEQHAAKVREYPAHDLAPLLDRLRRQRQPDVRHGQSPMKTINAVDKPAEQCAERTDDTQRQQPKERGQAVHHHGFDPKPHRRCCSHDSNAVPGSIDTWIGSIAHGSDIAAR